MEIGLGVMEMAPDDFWGMTMGEFVAKFDGWQERNGGKGKSKPPPMIKAELDALREHYPDGGSIRQAATPPNAAAPKAQPQKTQ